MDNYNNIKQRVFVHVGTEKITMGDALNLVQGKSY